MHIEVYNSYTRNLCSNEEVYHPLILRVLVDHISWQLFSIYIKRHITILFKISTLSKKINKIQRFVFHFQTNIPIHSIKKCRLIRGSTGLTTKCPETHDISGKRQTIQFIMFALYILLCHDYFYNEKLDRHTLPFNTSLRFVAHRLIQVRKRHILRIHMSSKCISDVSGLILCSRKLLEMCLLCLMLNLFMLLL